MEKSTHQSKDIIVLSFHNTLYPNPQHNYLEEIIPRRITRALDFFYELFTQAKFPAELNPFFVLISKTDSALKQEVLNILKAKGYQIHEAFFNPLDKSLNPIFNKNVDPQLYNINFWSWKQSIITMYNLCPTKNSLTVIDSDMVICQMAQRLGVRALKSGYMLIDDKYHLIFKESNPVNPEVFECCHPYFSSLWEPKAREQYQKEAIPIYNF